MQSWSDTKLEITVALRPYAMCSAPCSVYWSLWAMNNMFITAADNKQPVNNCYAAGDCKHSTVCQQEVRDADHVQSVLGIIYESCTC